MDNSGSPKSRVRAFNVRISRLASRVMLVQLSAADEAWACTIAVWLQSRLACDDAIAEATSVYAEVYVALLPQASPLQVVARIEQELRMVPSTLELTAAEAGRTHRLLVDYNGADLAAVAKTCCLTLAEVISLHTSVSYRVMALGFQPGFAYLGNVPVALRLPRLSTPRTRVPAGSVAIAADQCAVYPHASPGGWHLLGVTDSVMVDPDAASMSILAVGDTVQFLPKHIA